MPEGKEPPPGSRAIARNGGTQASGGCSVGSSPVLQGLEPSWQAVLGSDGSASGVPAGGPIYVRWSQQGGQHWRDQASEAAAAAAAQSRMVLPETPEGTSQDLLQQVGDGTDAERSVMVCRHWKSKGWCRLEDSCRFSHPEHKRGGTVTGGGGAKKNTSSGSGAANGGSAAAAGGETKGPSRRTRRSRRGNGSGGAAAAAAAASNEANGGGGGNNGGGAVPVPAAASMAPGLLVQPALQQATTPATGGSSVGGNVGGGTSGA